MKNIHVIVVPEKDEFAEEFYYEGIVYLNPDLGVPKLDLWNAKYLAPFWLDNKEQNVMQIYQIKKYIPKRNVIEVGNSYVLEKAWNNMSQKRRFAYYPLTEFNFIEIKDGFLFPYDFNK